MNAGKFTIENAPGSDFVRVTLRGHWDLDTVKDYKLALTDTLSQMKTSGLRPCSTVALVDAREVAAQTQDVIAFYKQHLGSDDLLPRRLATLLSSALFKRQVERIAMPNQRIFTDEAEAMAWLLES